jgi:hypothetical protein
MKSPDLHEELRGDSREVVFRSPSRYARRMGAMWLLVSMLWLGGVLYTLGAEAVRKHSPLLYVMTAVYSLPGVVSILMHLGILWTRRTVVINRAEETITETTRSPFKTRTVQYRLAWVRCVQLTYWIDRKTTWYVGIDVGNNHRVQLGYTPREADARHLSDQLAQFLGVPLRDQAAEATAS